MYKYSMTQWIMGNEDIELSFKRLKKFGYDGIEFAAEPYTIDQDRMVDLLGKYGMECTSLCGIFPENRDLTDKNGEEAVKYLTDSVDFAVKVGAPYIIVVPSPVGRAEKPANIPFDELWENAVKNIRKAADYAAEHNIRFAVEAVNRYETYFANTMGKAYKLVKDIDHPAVGIMADVFHMSLEENSIPNTLMSVADELMHVHIADNTREAAGLGNVDFKAIMYTLKNIGYKGPLTMEFMPRLSNPYASGDMDTKSELMDMYADQAISYLKALEKSLVEF